jgi:hypothetical protein
MTIDSFKYLHHNNAIATLGGGKLGKLGEAASGKNSLNLNHNGPKGG